MVQTKIITEIISNRKCSVYYNRQMIHNQLQFTSAKQVELISQPLRTIMLLGIFCFDFHVLLAFEWHFFCTFLLAYYFLIIFLHILISHYFLVYLLYSSCVFCSVPSSFGETPALISQFSCHVLHFSSLPDPALYRTVPWITIF